MVEGTFSGNCPHCRTRKTGFDILYHVPRFIDPSGDPLDYSCEQTEIFAKCRNCDSGVVGRTTVTEGLEFPNPIFGDIEIVSFQSNIMELKYIPPGVKDDYTEGVQNIGAGSYTSAGMIFRRALETGMKDNFPRAKGNLKKRIDWAKDNNRLTKEMAEWAHTIRALGNEAAHSYRLSKEDAEEMQKFTHLVLLYLFTLPGMMKNAQEKKVSDPEKTDATNSIEE